MKKKIVIGVVLFMGIVSIFGSLFHKREHMPIEPSVQGEKNEIKEIPDIEPSGEYVFLQELLICDEAHAVKIAETFESATGKTLDNAELVSAEMKYKILKVETPDKTYYLRVNSVNVLNKICEDSVTGKVIFQIIY